MARTVPKVRQAIATKPTRSYRHLQTKTLNTPTNTRFVTPLNPPIHKKKNLHMTDMGGFVLKVQAPSYFIDLMRLTISLANSTKALLPLADGSNTTPGKP